MAESKMDDKQQQQKQAAQSNIQPTAQQPPPGAIDMFSRMMFLQRELILQMRVQNRLHNGVFSFPYRSRRFKLALPDASSDLTQRTIIDSGTFKDLMELEQLSAMLDPGAVIIDAGANIGNHTIYWASMIEDAIVHSFEPLEHCYLTLKNNIRLNKLDKSGNVIVYCAALGNEEGHADIAAWSSAPGEALNIGGTRLKGSHNGEFNMTTVDSLKLDRLDLLKIDVEGMQLEVLQGAVDTIKKCMPIIFIELLPGPQQHTQELWSKEHEVDAPLRLLWEYGYKANKITQMDWWAIPRDAGHHSAALRNFLNRTNGGFDDPRGSSR